VNEEKKVNIKFIIMVFKKLHIFIIIKCVVFISIEYWWWCFKWMDEVYQDKEIYIFLW